MHVRGYADDYETNTPTTTNTDVHYETNIPTMHVRTYDDRYETKRSTTTINDEYTNNACARVRGRLRDEHDHNDEY